MKTIIGRTLVAVAMSGAVLLAGCRDTATVAATAAATPGGTLVNCGEGRQALVRPVTNGAPGTTQVECVAVAPTYTPASYAFANQAYVQPALAPAVVEPYRAPAGDRIYRAAPAPRVTRARYEQPRARTRSWKKSALIIGGSAAGGAGIGAIIDGGSGAKKGAVIGGVAGVVYDIATRNKNP
jgi:hypothetical protein